MMKIPSRILVLLGVSCGSLIAGITFDQLTQPTTIAQTSASPTPSVTAVSCQQPTQMPRVRTIFPNEIEVIPGGSSSQRIVRIPNFHQDCATGNSGNNLRAYVEPNPEFTYRVAGGGVFVDRVQMYRADDPTRRVLTEWDCHATIGYDSPLPDNLSFAKAVVRYYCCNNCN